MMQQAQEQRDFLGHQHSFKLINPCCIRDLLSFLIGSNATVYRLCLTYSDTYLFSIKRQCFLQHIEVHLLYKILILCAEF